MKAVRTDGGLAPPVLRADMVAILFWPGGLPGEIRK
jgi:hypothetical protein